MATDVVFEGGQGEHKIEFENPDAGAYMMGPYAPSDQICLETRQISSPLTEEMRFIRGSDNGFEFIGSGMKNKVVCFALP